MCLQSMLWWSAYFYKTETFSYVRISQEYILNKYYKIKSIKVTRTSYATKTAESWKKKFVSYRKCTKWSSNSSKKKLNSEDCFSFCQNRRTNSSNFLGSNWWKDEVKKRFYLNPAEHCPGVCFLSRSSFERNLVILMKIFWQV